MTGIAEFSSLHNEHTRINSSIQERKSVKQKWWVDTFCRLWLPFLECSSCSPSLGPPAAGEGVKGRLRWGMDASRALREGSAEMGIEGMEWRSWECRTPIKHPFQSQWKWRIYISNFILSPFFSVAFKRFCKGKIRGEDRNWEYLSSWSRYDGSCKYCSILSPSWWNILPFSLCHHFTFQYVQNWL